MKKQLNTTIIYVLSIQDYSAAALAVLDFFIGSCFLIAHNKVKDATENPDDYDGNINAMNTAKTIALVSLIINALYFIYYIYDLFLVA